ncbi:hypothetical protein RI129_008188 [Pyrocoelia pectoralis]|uniref:Uncharacterized protein n=1 Tax=Pyrocoelia pectoralis TaxID=417401 RepID=A0AAN7ZK45_9COLE
MLLGQNWEFSYYFWGGSAVIWFILFIVLCYANPATHPRVTPEEKLLLNRVTGVPSSV